MCSFLDWELCSSSVSVTYKHHSAATEMLAVWKDLYIIAHPVSAIIVMSDDLLSLGTSHLWKHSTWALSPGEIE